MPVTRSYPKCPNCSAVEPVKTSVARIYVSRCPSCGKEQCLECVRRSPTDQYAYFCVSCGNRFSMSSNEIAYVPNAAFPGPPR